MSGSGIFMRLFLLPGLAVLAAMPSVAAAALRRNVYAPVGLATNYHTTAIHPYWAPSLTPQIIVGAHIFYRRPGSSTLDAFSQTPSENEPDIAAPQVRYAVARTTIRT